MLNASSNELITSLKEEVKALTEEVKKLSSVQAPVIKGIQGLANYLGISRSIAQKMKNDGVIPYIQYDRVVLFEPDKVLTALALQTPRYNR